MHYIVFFQVILLTMQVLSINNNLIHVLEWTFDVLWRRLSIKYQSNNVFIPYDSFLTNPLPFLSNSAQRPDSVKKYGLFQTFLNVWVTRFGFWVTPKSFCVMMHFFLFFTLDIFWERKNNVKKLFFVGCAMKLSVSNRI